MLPGRLWADWSEMASHHVAGELRPLAMHIARKLKFEDVLLPADTDTIEFLMPDEEGNPVVHEALPPGTRIVMRFREGGPL